MLARNCLTCFLPNVLKLIASQLYKMLHQVQIYVMMSLSYKLHPHILRRDVTLSQHISIHTTILTAPFYLVTHFNPTLNKILVMSSLFSKWISRWWHWAGLELSRAKIRERLVRQLPPCTQCQSTLWHECPLKTKQNKTNKSILILHLESPSVYTWALCKFGHSAMEITWYFVSPIWQIITPVQKYKFIQIKYVFFVQN